MRAEHEGAVWNDGHPANLRAAAWDALDWIDVLMKHAAYIRMPVEDLRRLKASRAALARELRRQPLGVNPSDEAQQQEYERVHSLAHAWAQECYFKGLGRPARIDETRGDFQKALRALIAAGVDVPRGGNDAQR